MRLYHFLSAKNALDDLTRRRIKLSQIDDLNDPFELWCSAQGDPEIRKALRKFKSDMSGRYGMLCFSRDWHNPVLWSHYSHKHQGICLGFDVDDQCVKAVNYVVKRTPLQIPPTEETMHQLLFTKHRDWSYEDEWRGWFRLDECDASTGHYFYAIDDKISLREVIAGPLCETPKAIIDSALRGYAGHIRPIKARLAFTTFEVVKNKQGF